MSTPTDAQMVCIDLNESRSSGTVTFYPDWARTEGTRSIRRASDSAAGAGGARQADPGIVDVNAGLSGEHLQIEQMGTG